MTVINAIKFFLSIDSTNIYIYIYIYIYILVLSKLAFNEGAYFFQFNALIIFNAGTELGLDSPLTTAVSAIFFSGQEVHLFSRRTFL